MLFSWGTRTLDCTGSLSPTWPVTGSLEQMGGIKRTSAGMALSKVVSRKWAYSFSWEQAPEAIVGQLNDMVASGDTVLFEDGNIGTYNFRLLAGDLSVGSTLFGIAGISAVFREV
jgi:hypothetical protein